MSRLRREEHARTVVGMPFSAALPSLPEVPARQRTALTGAAGAYATAAVLAQHLWVPS